MKRIGLVVAVLFPAMAVGDNEILLGSGFEPVVAANRGTTTGANPTNRVTIDYMHGRGSAARVRRRFSESQGLLTGTWNPVLTTSEGVLLHDGYTEPDPAIVADTSSCSSMHG